MKLLEKARHLNRFLQSSARVKFRDIAKALKELTGANVYIVLPKGDVAGYSVLPEFDFDVMYEQVQTGGKLSSTYSEYLKGVMKTEADICEGDPCPFIEDIRIGTGEKRVTVVPINGNGERIGTIVLSRYDRKYTEEDLLLAEYAGAVVGVEILQDRQSRMEETARKKAMVKIAFSTLSFSEWEAIDSILRELNAEEGILVASKVADSVGITRSVIVNAMRKFESAGLIETKSLGMKGTYIKIKNEFLMDEINKHM